MGEQDLVLVPATNSPLIVSLLKCICIIAENKPQTTKNSISDRFIERWNRSGEKRAQISGGKRSPDRAECSIRAVIQYSLSTPEQALVAAIQAAARTNHVCVRSVGLVAADRGARQVCVVIVVGTGGDQGGNIRRLSTLS